MQEYQITCIKKPNRSNVNEHITHIGNISAGWLLTREDAIRRIDSKEEAFYTKSNGTGQKAYVGVVRNDGNRAPYLRTYADGRWNNNLLSLNECDGPCKLIG